MATEKRLIDVCAEIRKIEEVLAERKEQAGSLAYKVFEAVKTALEKAPTVDAVEVVRCKDCKDHDRCEVEDLLVKFLCIENAYCAAGERRTNDNRT